jgi:UDP-2,3-diacylglucosamine hydrolase
MESRASGTDKQAGPLAIICGGGSLPHAVAKAVTGRGRPVALLALRGFADEAQVAQFPHHWIGLGQYGAVRRLLKQEACRDVVFIGSLVRPSLRQLQFDWATVMLIPRLLRMFRGGDNRILSGVLRLFEQDGFRVLGAHEVAPEIMVPEGSLGRVMPSERDLSDILLGMDLIAAIGPFDVGQAVVVANNHVLAVEGIEGTDQMLARVAELRRTRRIRAPEGIGVLIKAAKPNQDRRVDLPSIGPHTIEGIVRARLAGVAVVAGETIIAEPARVADAADQAGIFAIGVRSRQPGAHV